MPRRLEIGDLDNIPMASSPQLSPDGASLAYVVTRIERDKYVPTLYIVEPRDGSPRRFLENARSPFWNPDGSQLAFVSTRGLKEGEAGAEVWVTTLMGDARFVCRAHGGVEQPMWGGDGSRIYFLSYVGEEPKDSRVIEGVPFWFDAVGWTHYRRKQLHYVDVASGVVRQVTNLTNDVACHAPSNKGNKVTYAASEDEMRPREMALYVENLDSKESRKVLGKHNITSLAWSPSDEDIAFLGNDLSRGYATHATLWVIPSVGGEAENLTKTLDRGSNRVVYNDLRSPFTGPPTPVWQDRQVIFQLSEGGRYNLYSVNPNGGDVKPLIAGDFTIEEFSIRGGIIAYTRTTTAEPMEIYVRDGGRESKITRLAEATQLDAPLTDCERFSFEASDGETIEGWILKPFSWKKGKKYPAIFDIHGGPKSKYGYSPMFEHQIYAAEGYTVIYANIRGSDGYDQEYADIRFRYGTRDYQDFMETVDHILGSYDWIDGGKIAVTGLSYGGFMTNWVIGHTAKFSCAISQNSICNWTSFFGTSDIGYHFTPDQIGGDPWSNPSAYAEKSPLTYAKDVTTPTLFIHSYNDYRCWIDQSFQMYTALKYLGKEAKLIVYMEGSHSFRNLARLTIRKQRLQDMVDWFNKYLK